MNVMRKLVTGAACAALAVFLGAQIAYADCMSDWGAKDGANRAECILIGSTDTSCTYECTCWGDCTNIYKSLGFRKINPAV